MIDRTLINENTDSIIQSLSAGIEHDRGFSELYNINCSRAAAKLDHYLATVSENQWIPETTANKDKNLNLRKKINWQSDSIIEELHLSYEAVTPLINQLFTQTKEKVFIGLNVWQDIEGYSMSMHTDNPIIAVALQVYHGNTAPEDCGTSFCVQDHRIVEIPYKHNHGYILEQHDDLTKRLLHAPSKPTPAGAKRHSIYAVWSYPEFKD